MRSAWGRASAPTSASRASERIVAAAPRIDVPSVRDGGPGSFAVISGSTFFFLRSFTVEVWGSDEIFRE